VDFQKTITDILILVLPAVLSYVFARLGIDKIKFQKYQRLIQLAEEAVLWAEDYYPEKEGVEKLKEAIEYLKNACIKAGLWISDEEAEKKVRVAYQRLQKEALSRLLRGALGE